MAESNLSKKQKTEDDTIQYFKDFLSNETNKELISELRFVVKEMEVGLGHSSVFFLRVLAANANSCVSFSKASIDVAVHRKSVSEIEMQVSVVAPFFLFFLSGHRLLVDFLDASHPKLPENFPKRQALRELLRFLSNVKEHSVLAELNDKKPPGSETALAVKLSQHLLLPLVPQKGYLIDNNYARLHDEKCCHLEHAEKKPEDTSFGCPKGWHGRADIIFSGDKVPLTVEESRADAGDSDVVSVASDSSVEVKLGDKFGSNSFAQVTAQTIAYSFVQHRANPLPPNHFVPGILLNSKQLIVNLYDCVADILLSTGPVDLFVALGDRYLNTRAVIILWLTLNHRLFGNKTPDGFDSYTANFHRILGPDQLEIYKNESSQPCKGSSDAEDVLKYMAQERGNFQIDLSNYYPEDVETEPRLDLK